MPCRTAHRLLCIPLLLWACLQGPSVAANEATTTPAHYGLQPGDIVAVTVWKEEDLKAEVMVRPDGNISFPLAGEIVARGRSIPEIQKDIAERIAKYIPEPVVTVMLKEIRGNVAYVIGKVNKPGPLLLVQDTDVMQALSIAGGTATFASPNKIIVLHREGGTQKAIAFRYGDIEEGKHLEQNILLHNGDVVVVP